MQAKLIGWNAHKKRTRNFFGMHLTMSGIQYKFSLVPSNVNTLGVNSGAGIAAAKTNRRQFIKSVRDRKEGGKIFLKKFKQFLKTKVNI